MVLVLLGLLLGLGVDLVALVIGVWGFFQRDARRGLTKAILATGLALCAIVLSLPVWVVTLRGRGTRDEPITWRDDGALYEIVALEAFVLVLSIASCARGARRLQR